MGQKRMIFSGHGIHEGTNERAQLSAPHLAGLNSELHRSNRPMTHWREPAAIDKDMVAKEFTREYNLRDVELVPIMPPRSEGRR
jgi:hypothetical protein